MKSIITNNETNFKYKDISNKDVIGDYKEIKKIQIKTKADKYRDNQTFAKSSSDINKSYKEKVIDNKQNLIKENIKSRNSKNNYISSIKKENAINNESEKTTKNNITENNQYQDERSKNSKNNRHYITRKVLREAEKSIDELLDVDEDDLGVETLRKGKEGIKGTGIISSKTINVNKVLGKKAYNIVTSEEVKEVYNTTKIAAKKVYNTSRDFATKIYVKNKVNKITNNKNILKEKQRKNIIKNAREKVKEKAEKLIIGFASKLKGALVEFFSHKIAITTLIILFVLLAIVSAIIGITSIASYSANLALDENASFIYEYVSELDNKINMQIDYAETNYSGFDEYIYNVPKRAGTNPEQVYSYLKAKYGDSKLSEEAIRLEIEQIHSKLYNISFVETTTTNTVIQEDGTEIIETKRILNITLTTKTFAEYYEANKNVLLSEEQQKDYEEILKLVQENVGKVLLNPFPGKDWREYVTSEYGYRIHPISHKYTMHTGLDIGMHEGTTINACMGGEVTVANAEDTGLGLSVTITNGKYKTVYGHCSKILVSSGDNVNAGDSIALVGNTGNSTGPHLHLEYMVNGKNKNPRTYLIVEK